MTATDDPVVLINIFKCDQRHLDELIERLAALAKVQSELPGFVSATLHRGLNGRVAANHAVWASATDWKAMTRHPRSSTPWVRSWPSRPSSLTSMNQAR